MGHTRFGHQRNRTNLIMTMRQEFRFRDVKCVTGIDAKEVGKEQPASYIVPLRQREYAKKPERVALVFCAIGVSEAALAQYPVPLQKLTCFFLFFFFRKPLFTDGFYDILTVTDEIYAR